MHAAVQVADPVHDDGGLPHEVFLYFSAYSTYTRNLSLSVCVCV
jgi:hypothetical protein